MRRRFLTRDRISVSLVHLQMGSPYFGAVEITRLDSATRFLLERAVERDDLVIGVDPAAPPPLLPPEELVAELHSDWLPDPSAVDEPNDHRTLRTLRCYQKDGEDPFSTLAAIVSELHWASVARVEHWR